VTETPKTTAMIEARRADARTKRQRVAVALEQVAAQGTPITFAEVARAAGVSSWLVYAPGLREVIEAARARQSTQPAAERSGRPGGPGLSTDLALARAEIARLRAERDEQRRQLSLALGARMDDLAKADLLARLDELTHHNGELAAALSEAQTEAATLGARIVELEDDLAAARTSLRRMIRAENRPEGA
jgi:chromosome segregation ATPase